MTGAAKRPLEGRVALVTGGAGGIGRACGRRLAEDGAVVVVADRDVTQASDAADAIRRAGGQATAIELDVRREDSWAATMNLLRDMDAPLEIVVHAAGIAGFGTMLGESLARWREIFEVNVEGTFLTLRYAIDSMRRTGRGSIVAIGSLYGTKPLPGAVAYSASKAAQAMIARAAALEVRQAGLAVRVNCILPGPVKTPIWRGHAHWPELVRRYGGEEGAFHAIAGGLSTKRFAEVDEIVGIVAFLASDEARHITGAEIAVDGGLASE